MAVFWEHRPPSAPENRRIGPAAGDWAGLGAATKRTNWGCREGCILGNSRLPEENHCEFFPILCYTIHRN